MAYVTGNPKTKKELKEMMEKGPVQIFQPGIGPVPHSGRFYLEGPHYPKPHKWYAVGYIENGVLVKIV